MKLKNIENLPTYIENLADDFDIDDNFKTVEMKQKFIGQVTNYATHCCTTLEQLSCYIDGLLTNFHE